jgi:hypothetical protein
LSGDLDVRYMNVAYLSGGSAMVLLVILIVAVSLLAQDVTDTTVGNLRLEWIRSPMRWAPDTGSWVLLPGYYPWSDEWAWPTTLKWLRSDRLAVIYHMDEGAAIETYDTAGVAQLNGFYRTMSSGERKESWYASQMRVLRSGQIGVWGCGFFTKSIRAMNAPTAPYPLHFQLDSALDRDGGSFISDTTFRRRTKVRTYYPDYLLESSNYAKDFVLSYDAETFDGNVCYILPDTSSQSWSLALYSEDLQRRVLLREYPLPYPAIIRDSMNRDSTILIGTPPYGIQSTVGGIAGRAYTVSGERVIVLFRGENFEETRAIRLPPAGLNVEYYVEDGYVVDFTISAQRLVISKVWENGVVEWQYRPIEPSKFGLLAPEYGTYRVRKSRWGGWYVVAYTADPARPNFVAVIVRLNGFGKITGYYRLHGESGLYDPAITDVVEHYADSSFYALGTRGRLMDGWLVLMKFRFHPSDTTTIDGIDTPSDTTLGVWDRAAYGGVEVYPQPVRRGEQLRVVAMADVEAVEVWTLDGRRVVGMAVERSGEVAGVSMDVPAGVYVVEVRSSGGRQQRGLVMVVP